MNAIGDRMKRYYEEPSRYLLPRRVPVIVRVDGRAFHTYTQGMSRPFDIRLINAMVDSARYVASNMQGFKLAYVQSDEASFLLTDYDSVNTDAWFGYTKSKVETIAASMMTASFNSIMRTHQLAHFDARAFSIPREDVANYFLWRAMDWERNSLAMYCGAFFSHKQMHGYGKASQHEMLHGIGKNWTTDLCEQTRNGTWITSDGSARTDFMPQYRCIADVVDPLVYCDRVEPQSDVEPFDTMELSEADCRPQLVQPAIHGVSDEP